MDLDEFPLFLFSGHKEVTQNMEFVYLNLHSSVLSHGLPNLIFTNPRELERVAINNLILR